MLFFNSRPPASSPAGGLILGPLSMDERPLFFEAVTDGSEKHDDVSAPFLAGCDESHNTLIYFLNKRATKKRRRNCTHTPSKVKPKA